MDAKRYALSPNFENGKFRNLQPTRMSMSARDMMKTLAEFIEGGEGRTPKEKIQVRHPEPAFIAAPNGSTRLVWFGHSSFLLQIDGMNLLIDPMFGPTPAPYPWMGRSRFTDGLPIAIADLPQIDAILLSHDHYDHLDKGSILALKAKTKEYFVPLGVGARLRSWGVVASRIQELDWWDETGLGQLHFAFTPARHFSGRGLMDRFSTLWGGWVIQGREDNIYFSADSGYGPHFADIGAKYGPFDLAMIECGQYNEKWADIHMMPEQSAQAAVDAKAKVMMPVHWGAFVLAMHSWTDPVERVTKKAVELGLPIITPRIGDVVALDALEDFHERWWLK
jgi:L-ascorbate metabolism protein UlaG (beta-lactamase superfamily)